MRTRLKYVEEYRDRHGRLRRYFRRRRDAPRIALPGEPGSPDFQQAYLAACAGLEIARKTTSNAPVGSYRAVLTAYYTDHKWLALAASSRQMRRRLLEQFANKHGEKPLSLLSRDHIVNWLGQQKPFAAQNWLKALRGLLQFAVAAGLCQQDPTADIARAKVKAGRIHTWTETEIAQFEARHAVGTQARLAMGLLLYTGQRRSDVVRMGPQHVRDGVLCVRQQKTGMSKADEVLEIPVHPDLAALIAASACGNLAFLVTEFGAPFSAAGFGNKFRDWCDLAGLTAACSAHGLRKAACRRLAEAGCTAPQIAAISGHKTLAEVQRYIAAADQARLARAAIGHLTTPLPNETGAKTGQKG